MIKYFFNVRVQKNFIKPGGNLLSLYLLLLMCWVIIPCFYCRSAVSLGKAGLRSDSLFIPIVVFFCASCVSSFMDVYGKHFQTWFERFTEHAPFVHLSSHSFCFTEWTVYSAWGEVMCLVYTVRDILACTDQVSNFCLIFALCPLVEWMNNRHWLHELIFLHFLTLELCVSDWSLKWGTPWKMAYWSQTLTRQPFTQDTVL